MAERWIRPGVDREAADKPGEDRYLYPIKQWPKTRNATATLLPRDMVAVSGYQLGKRDPDESSER